MANSYLDALKDVQLLLQEQYNDWDEIDKKILKIASNAQKISMSDADGSIKELNARIQQNIDVRKQMNQTLAEQEAQIKALQAQLAKLSAAQSTNTKTLSDDERMAKKVADSVRNLNDARRDETKTIEHNRVAANMARKEARQQAQELLAVSSAYDAASLRLRKITKDYQNLAIRKAQNNDLTDQEILKMNELEAEINQLRPQLVEIDHKVGNFGRSVGSYGKKFDSLGFSMAQITRELPAFAYGAQIGFAALSNNIPILADEIIKVRQETAKLRKEGKATSSVMSQLGAAVFSWQSLLSIGVTLLTLYGAEMIEMAFGATEAEKAQKALTEAMAKAEAESKEASRSMRSLIAIMKDDKVSMEARKEALEQLAEEVKELKGVELEQAGAMQTIIDKSAPYIRAAEARAKADAFARLAAEAEAKLVMMKREGLDKTLTSTEKAAAAVKGLAGAFSGASPIYTYLTEKTQTYSGKLGEQAAIVKALNDTYMDYLADALEAESQIADETDKVEDNTKAKKRAKIVLEDLSRTQKFSVAYYEQTIAALQKSQKEVSKTSDTWAQYQKAIEEAQTAIAIITDLQGWARDEMAMSADEVARLNDEVIDFLTDNGISRGMQDLSKFTGESLEELARQFYGFYQNDFDGFMEFYNAKMAKREEEKERMKELQKEIVEAAIGLTSALFEADIEKIQQKIDANKDYYAQLLDNAELTEERRSALEAERDAKERKLMAEKRKRENQQFLFEQGVALAKSIINTAVAVTEALPNLALATLVGILGGIEAATIIATAVPKFAGGTMNAKEGMAIVDEVRPEVHTDKYGNVKSFGSEKGANFRFLKQGDKIYRSREEYFKNLKENQIENVIWGLNMQHQGRPIAERDVNEAVVRELSALRGENARVWREVKRLASRPISNSITVEVPDNRPY